jgi:hypothetical protein
MSDQVVRVSNDWLALREPADAAARSRELVECLRPPAAGRWEIHDLGGATGSMGRWLAPLLAGPQHWIVHDRDTDLLALAELPVAAADGAAVTFETTRSDITRLRPDELAGATLTCASALLDMLTEDELGRLVSACAGAGCPSLLCLSVVGRVALKPADPLDRRVGVAFNDHQRRATERGRLLGPDAAAIAIEQFRRLGAEVLVRSSPWRLGVAHAELAAVWFTGWVRAAYEQHPELFAEAEAEAEAAGYTRRRLAQAAAGELEVTVDHADVLALPG